MLSIRDMAGALGCRITTIHSNGMHPQQPGPRRAAIFKCGRHAFCISCAKNSQHNAPDAVDTARDTSVSAFSEEHQEAMKTAAMCEKRHCRLTFKAEHMKEAAVKALQIGNEKDARRLLEVKAKVLESAAASLRRAQVNRALATKLEEVLRAHR